MKATANGPNSTDSSMTANSRPFLTRPSKALLAVLVVLSIVAIGWGPKLRREVLACLGLNSDAPAQSAVEELSPSDDDPFAFLSRFW